jgi:hypothetical protein
MTAFWWTMVGLSTLTMTVAVLVWFWSRKRRGSIHFAHARKRFHLRREWLEAEFITEASRAYKPRGLVWPDCEFDDEAVFATDRNTGQLRAFTGVSVRVKTAEPDAMADDPFADSPRAATAVFYFDGREWTTQGRALFNLSPLEAVERFKHELKMVD